jgi:hypothetical protein
MLGRSVGVSAVLFATVLLGGCAVLLSVTVGGCAPRLSVGTPCTRNGECSEGLVCGVGGRCRVECVESRDCTLGARCLRDPVTDLNGCSLETDSCSAGTCEGGLRCVEGLCLGVCLGPNDCPDGRCTDGACEIPASTDAGVDAPPAEDASGDAGACGIAPLFTSVSVGLGATCAATAAGEVFCWGDSNIAGTLGAGTDCMGFCTPTPIRVMTSAGGALTGVLAVATGAGIACALTSPGEVYCWGSDRGGPAAQPIRLAGGATLTDVEMIAAGRGHACALVRTGQVFCWGRGTEGQLGGVADSIVALPVGGVGATRVVTAEYRTLIQAGGTLRAVGDNDYAALGVTPGSTPVGEVVDPGVAAIQSVAAARDNTCILVDNQPSCWGAVGALTITDSPMFANCGPSMDEPCDTTATPFLSPVPLVDFVADPFGTSAIGWDVDGTAYGWGASYGLILAENAVTVPTRLIAIGQATQRVSIGAHTACAILGSGGSGPLVCWGRNDRGQLGRGTVTPDAVTVPDERFGAPPCWPQP